MTTSRRAVGARLPLVGLVRTSPHYRSVFAGFVARMTGSYAAALAAIWGAWRYGSPERAAWLVVSISVASALGALWVGHRHDRGGARPLLLAAGGVEMVACTVLAIGGTRPTADVVLLSAGAAAGVARAVWSAAVTPALADAAGPARVLGAFGVGWAYDFGKLAGAAVVAGVLAWSPAVVAVPGLIALGTVLFTRHRIAPHATAAADPARPVVAAPIVRRATAAIAVASFCLYQQDLLFRVALDQPVWYAIAAAAFAVGAIVATAQLAASVTGRLPTRRALMLALVASAAGTSALLIGPDPVSAVGAAVAGWGCAYGFQGCRPVFAWAARPGLASGWQTAWTTVATATGAPVAVAVLPHALPATVLIAASVVVGGALVPDVSTAITRAQPADGGAG